MNRKQRRKAKTISVNDPAFTLKKSDIDRMILKARNDAKEEAIEEAFILMMAIPVKVMHDRYGWRMKKRLPELAEAITDEFQRFSEGEMTAEQYRQFVFENCGLMFKRSED